MRSAFGYRDRKWLRLFVTIPAVPIGVLRTEPPKTKIEPEPEDGPKQRGQRPHQIHDPHRLRVPPFIGSYRQGAEQSKSEEGNRKIV
jgi:hypothetical protein